MLCFKSVKCFNYDENFCQNKNSLMKISISSYIVYDCLIDNGAGKNVSASKCVFKTLLYSNT